MDGIVGVFAEKIRDDLFKVRVHVRNVTSLETPPSNRDEALTHALVSSHTILGVKDGEFISLLDPPSELQKCVAIRALVGRDHQVEGNHW